MSQTKQSIIIRQSNKFEAKRSTQTQQASELLSMQGRYPTVMQRVLDNSCSLNAAKVAYLQRTIGNQRLHQAKNLIAIAHNRLQRQPLSPMEHLKGHNEWYPNQGLARIAALRYATQLGIGYSIKHHPSPAIGLPHYHVVSLSGKRVQGHFFYGKKKELRKGKKTQKGYRQRSTITAIGVKRASRATWKQFWKTVAKRFAIRGATAAALAAVDGPLPIGDLISLGLAIWTVWDIIDLWDELWDEAVNEPEA
jgi:hypothetical protein